VRGVEVACKHVFNAPVSTYHFAFSVVTPWGYKASGRPCVNLHPFERLPVASSPPSLWLKRKRGREIDIETGERELLSLQGIASPSILNYGGAGLDPIRGHVGVSVGPR
jgi:hypothetical protein